MIFVTVGTQLPFDRLVAAVDRWAAAHAEPAFAQIGESAFRPRHMEWVRRLSVTDFQLKLREAQLVVSHAGIGVLLAALEARKPLIAMPRREALNEIRSDHQIATAQWLREVPGITVADDVEELAAALDAGAWTPPQPPAPEAPAELIAAIRSFIES